MEIKAQHIPWRRYSAAFRDERIAKLLASRLMPYMKSVRVKRLDTELFQIFVRGIK